MCIHTHHIFFIHSSADGHVGRLHVLAIVNSAAGSIAVPVSLGPCVSLDIRPGVGLQEQRVVLF